MPPTLNAVDEFIPIKTFARQIQRTSGMIRLWHKRGVLNRNTGERIRCNLTRLPSGEWAITNVQYLEFVAALNKQIGQ